MRGRCRRVPRSSFTRVALALLAELPLVGCASTAKQADADKTPVFVDDPMPESVEWLFATKGTSGARADECRKVTEVLEGEAECGGALCHHAVLLGEDWIKVCEKLLPANVVEVKALLATFRTRQENPTSSCETEAEAFTDRGCKQADACAEAAQDWMTRCGDKFGTPLIVNMFERELARVSKETQPKLDPRGCETLFADVTRTTTCDNDFDCEDKAKAVEKYRARCETPFVPIPIDRALREGRLLVAAGRAPKAIPVAEGEFSASAEGVYTRDRRAVVLALNRQPVSDVRQLMKTLHESEHVQEVQVARVFRAKHTMYEVRFGSLQAADAKTFYKRFPSLRFEGQRAALESLFEQDMIQEISEALNTRGTPAVALRHVVRSLQTPLALTASTGARKIFTDADRRLAPIFAGLGLQKARWLRGMGPMPSRVPATRRSIDLPLADVDLEGNLAPGTSTEAVFAKLGDVLPESVNAYLKSLSGAVAEVSAVHFSDDHEGQLLGEVKKIATRCVDARTLAETQERALLDCAFQVQSQKVCSSTDWGAVVSALDAALERATALRRELQLSFVALRAALRREPPAAVTTCFGE